MRGARRKSLAPGNISGRIARWVGVTKLFSFSKKSRSHTTGEALRRKLFFEGFEIVFACRQSAKAQKVYKQKPSETFFLSNEIFQCFSSKCTIIAHSSFSKILSIPLIACKGMPRSLYHQSMKRPAEVYEA